MDSASLRTASEYLNNLLLARGLLRNGASIDFVRPSKDSRAQIINLVHDLVLRSDRDREQKEKAAIAYRQIRANDDQKTQEIERLQVKEEDAGRAVIRAQTAERAAREEVKRVEKAGRALQEQVTKLKTSLSQVKTQCLTDVKKRDLELARLKTHLQGQQRGNRSVTVAPSITISGHDRKPIFDASVHNVMSPEYTLRQETNAFLTKLSQGLSEENDQMLHLLRNTLDRLQSLLGWKDVRRANDSGIGEDSIQATPFEQLTTELEATLSQMKDLLTNPNFVSIEEVEIREDEISRMRADFDKMEQRWKDLLKLMDGWRKRMDTGGNIDTSDLRRGIGLLSPDSDRTTNMTTMQHQETTFGESIDQILKPREKSTPPHSGRSSPKRKRDPLEPPMSFDLRPRDQKQRLRQPDQDTPNAIPSKWLADFSDDESEELEVPSLSIEQKLSAAAQEAAVVRDLTGSEAKLHDADVGAYDHDTIGNMPTQIKKSRITGRPKRRKSTLSRDELAELLADEH